DADVRGVGIGVDADRVAAVGRGGNVTAHRHVHRARAVGIGLDAVGTGFAIRRDGAHAVNVHVTGAVGVGEHAKGRAGDAGDVGGAAHVALARADLDAKGVAVQARGIDRAGAVGVDVSREIAGEDANGGGAGVGGDVAVAGDVHGAVEGVGIDAVGVAAARAH